MKNINLQESEMSAGSTAGHLPDTAWGQGRKIKVTSSICPQCLSSVEAQVLEREGEVWMDKACDQHGRFSALLSSDIQHYYEPLEQPLEGKSCCGSSCGPSPSADVSGQMDESGAWVNHSCTILIEITERCNLTCPTCFAGSSPQHSHMMELDEFARQVDQLVAGGKSGSDMIQLSGGEPTIHPQFMAMIELLFDRGFKKVCINSNGIKLALCEANNISIHPVLTLTRGIDDHEVGNFVQLAVDTPELKNVVIQPAMYSSWIGDIKGAGY